ncbi:MAG: small multi-drug export protein [Candidatus Thermoplasmatota archaeon]|nr:small multi-drug export protein [Candidatus Thermoplasmatota archaeon]
MIDQLPQWAYIFLFSMMPGVESKVVVPFAIYEFQWQWYQAFFIGLLGNIVLVPFGPLFLHKLESFLSKYERIKKIMEKIFSRIRKRADKKIQRYEYLGLLLIVALPLPFTGAGLGVIIAYLFNLDFSRSIITIFIGVDIATSITTFLYLVLDYVLF